MEVAAHNLELELDGKQLCSRLPPQFLAVAGDDNEEPIELPCEDDGSLLLSTLQGQFPGACGLQYRSLENNTLRGIRLVDGRLYPPDYSHSFVCVFPKDGRGRRRDDTPDTRARRFDRRRCTDLIVLGVPWRTTDEELRRHFETYGPLVLCTIKRDAKSGESRGFGFIRFQEYEAQVMCVANRHFIDGRWCDVKIPNSRQHEGQDNAEYNRKVFVGRLNDEITEEELYKYFSQFGKVVDVFIPRPFRSFAFVTFAEQEVAHAMLNKEHKIKACDVIVGTAVPKVPHHVHQQQQQQNHHFNHHPPAQHYHPRQAQNFNTAAVYQSLAAAAAGLQHQQPTPKFGRGGGAMRSGPGYGQMGAPGPTTEPGPFNVLNPAVLAALGNMLSTSCGLSDPPGAPATGPSIGQRSGEMGKPPGSGYGFGGPGPRGPPGMDEAHVKGSGY